MTFLTSRPAIAFGAALPALLLLGACSQTAPTSQPVTISGHIDHPKGPKVYLTLFRDPLRLASDTVSARLDAQGNFRLALPQVAAPGEALLGAGDEMANLFVEPGDSLHLSLDTEQFDETLRFKGRGAAANSYLAQSFLRFDDGDNASPMRFVVKKTAAQMTHLVEANEQERRSFWQQYAAQHPVTPAFRAYVRQTLAYNAANQRMMCTIFFRHLHKDDQPATPLPAAFLAGLQPLATPNDSALNNNAYLSFVQQYPMHLVQLTRPVSDNPMPEDAFEPAFEQAIRVYGNTRTRDVVLAQLLLQELQMGSFQNAQAKLPVFRQLNRDSLAAREVRSTYTKRLALAPGSAAPAFTLQDETGKQVALSSFRGKVVYLDFWASWCGPCLAEIPAATELKQKFAGRDVVFLYVSIDEREKDWQNMLAKRKLLGHGSVHLRAQGFNSATAKAYQINAIPAYFIIGRDGQLVADQAPRPSSGAQVVAALEAALAAPAVDAVAAR
ncbi:TlpA family protein disulfide reductase [Hymenobacter jeollabukensis]|uniref:AhpC/TSA family protein n=1 Tax=Hymenobacter jeollabukensis TaxID=2025313 RepID=A0A5R8WU98_9BACT|nr:TlpA disulfide reductase family protein [Hymenobacter jeollabukensis]TLM95307.1 AhpC/TSA family protein [Hymenobacter jeollabukensis]